MPTRSGGTPSITVARECFFRAAHLPAIGDVDESLNFLMDYDYTLRFLAVTGIAPLHQELAVIRHHDACKSVKDGDEFVWECVRIVRPYQAKFPDIDARADREGAGVLFGFGVRRFLYRQGDAWRFIKEGPAHSSVLGGLLAGARLVLQKMVTSQISLPDAVLVRRGDDAHPSGIDPPLSSGRADPHLKAGPGRRRDGHLPSRFRRATIGSRTAATPTPTCDCCSGARRRFACVLDHDTVLLSPIDSLVARVADGRARAGRASRNAFGFRSESLQRPGRARMAGCALPRAAPRRTF